MNTELSKRTSKTRIPRKCIWCGEAISVGDTYVRVTQTNEGDFQVNHFHPECYTDMVSDEFVRQDGEFYAYENPRPAKNASDLNPTPE